MPEVPGLDGPNRPQARALAAGTRDPATDGAAGQRGLAERLRQVARAALPRNAVVLAVLLLAGAAMSFLNLRVLGHEYGAGAELDAWSAASRLPQLALDILVTGGVVGPFLPLFVGLQGESAARAEAFGRTILTLAVLVMAAAMAIMFMFAEQTLSIVAPGFTGAQRDLYVGLFRVLCFSQVVFAASWVLGEVLVAERRFVAYGLAEPLYYAGISGGALLLGGPLGIYGAAVGAVAGATAHLGIRLIGLRRTGFRPLPALALRTSGLGEFLRLMAPKMLSQPILSLTALYFTGLASSLAAGSVTSFTFAQHFQSLPENLCGVAFATAAFPALSAAAAAGDRAGFRRVFTTNMLTIAALSLTAAAAVLLLGPIVIGTFLAGGAFTATDVARTTMVASIFAISIPFESLTELFARGIYATRNTLEPTAAAIAGFAATVLSATALSGSLGLAAIPTAYAIGMATKLAILAVALAPRIGRIGAPRWSHVMVSGRWVTAQPRRRPAAVNPVLALFALVLAGASFAAIGQASSHSSLDVIPVVTPWARVEPSAPPVIAAASPTASPSPAGTEPSASPSPALPTPAGSPTPTPTPGPFSMDLYKPGDFVGELRDSWCVPAAMQTSMNIMNVYPDVTEDTQAKLYDLAYSIAGGTYGGADPEGWAAGLTQLGYGRYQVGSKAKMADVIHLVAKQIRATQRPAGLLVWYGWHSWVVSGFTATADPALTDAYAVTSLRIEDVWYPRHSNLWNQDRGGYSRPPDSDVDVSLLPADYKVWHQGKVIPGREGLYVYVIPV